MARNNSFSSANIGSKPQPPKTLVKTPVKCWTMESARAILMNASITLPNTRNPVTIAVARYFQAGGQQEAEDEQRRQQPKHVEEVQRQVVQGRRTGRYQFAHRDVVEGNQQQRRQHRERNADQPGHRPQRQVLVVLALEHGQADRDQVDDGRAGGVAHQHGSNPHVAVGGQGIGQLVAAHVHRDDRQRGDGYVGTEGLEERAEGMGNRLRQIGNGYHDAGLGEEHRTDGVDAVDELAAQTAFRAQDGSQRAKYRTQHDQVNHIVSELGHLRRSPLGRLP